MLHQDCPSSHSPVSSPPHPNWCPCCPQGCSRLHPEPQGCSQQKWKQRDQTGICLPGCGSRLLAGGTQLPAAPRGQDPTVTHCPGTAETPHSVTPLLHETFTCFLLALLPLGHLPCLPGTELSCRHQRESWTHFTKPSLADASPSLWEHSKPSPPSTGHARLICPPRAVGLARLGRSRGQQTHGLGGLRCSGSEVATPAEMQVSAA